jgi:hypothetical protein
MPPSIRKVLERAIEARERCADWYQAAKIENEYSNEGHRHFIDILEHAHSILETGPSETKRQRAKTVPRGQEDADKFLNDVTNRFHGLQVDDLLDVDDNESINSEGVVYELQEGSETTMMSLRIFCLFEDLHQIQDFLHNAWTDFKSEKIDLTAVSLLTNVAFDLVRRSEQQILDAAPHLFSAKDSYNTIAVIIFYANALSQGMEPDPKSLIPTPFDDFIYLSTARTLFKAAWIAQAPEKFDYPFPCPPMGLTYQREPELLNNAYMKQKLAEDVVLSQLIMDNDMFCQICKSMREDEQYTPIVDVLSKGLDDLLSSGDVTIWLVFASRVFLDIREILGQDARNSYGELHAYALHVEQSLKPARLFESAQTKSTELCFGEHDKYRPCKVLALSLEWIIRKNEFSCEKEHKLPEIRVHKQLQHYMWSFRKDKPTDERSTTSCASTVDQDYTNKEKDRAKKVNLGTVNIPKGFKFDPRESKVMQLNGLPENIHPAKLYIYNLLIQSVLNGKIDEETGEPKFEVCPLMPQVFPNDDINSIFTDNPLLCGLIKLGLVLDQEQAGIDLSNLHISTTLIASLYIEARREGLLDTKWTEMDQFVKKHFGEKLPNSASEAFIGFTTVMGLTPGHISLFTNGKVCQFYKTTEDKSTDLGKALRPFLDYEADFASAVNSLERHIQDRRLLVESGTKHRRRNARRKPTPLQFLGHLKDYLSQELPKVQIDYIGLVRTCHMLLKNIRLEILRELKINHKLLPTDSIIQPYSPYMVMAILTEAKNAEGPRHRKNDLPSWSPKMAVVAKVLKKYISVKDAIQAAK